jgi:type I restriction enzyme, S subunit
MYTTTVFSDELEGRFDVKYYNPVALELQRKIKSKCKKKGYELKILNDFGHLRKGIFYIPTTEYKSNGVPFIRVSCIKYQTIDIEDLTYITKKWHDGEKKTKVIPGDIVISKSGTIGNVAIISKWLGESNISQDIVGFNIDDKKYSGFLLAYLASRLGRIQMNKMKTQQTHAHLTLTPLRKLMVLFNEDKALEISNIINKATEYEDLFFMKINEAKKILNEALNIDVHEEDYLSYSISNNDLDSKFTPIYYYPKYLKTNVILKKKFKTIKLGKISKIIKGIEPGSKNYQKEGIPFIRTSDFVNYGIDRDSYHKLSEKLYDVNKQDLLKNDILFSNDGKIGFSSMLVENDKCIIQSHLRRIRINKNGFTPEYVFIYLNTKFGLYQVYRRTIIQTTISTIEKGLYDIDIPCLEDEIVDKITDTCKKAFEYKSKRNTLIEDAINRVEKMIEE